MCRSRVLMLNQKSHFYSVQLFEEEVRKDNTVHLSGSVHDKLFTQTALCKWLRRWRNKSSVWACFFKIYISFYVVKISSVFYSVLLIQLFCSASLCQLAETGQWKTFGSSFTVLFFRIFSNSCGRSRAARLTPRDCSQDQCPVMCLRATQSVFAWPVVLCVGHISVCNRNRELVRCYV